MQVVLDLESMVNRRKTNECDYMRRRLARHGPKIFSSQSSQPRDEETGETVQTIKAQQVKELIKKLEARGPRVTSGKERELRWRGTATAANRDLSRHEIEREETLQRALFEVRSAFRPSTAKLIKNDPSPENTKCESNGFQDFQ